MTDHLELDDLLYAAERILGAPPQIRDAGLLESALHRPRATWYGDEIYTGLDEKAAALLLSLVGNHPLIDGNKRVGWVAARLLYSLNGYEIRAPRSDAYELVMAVARGEQDDVAAVASVLRSWRTSA